MEEDEPTIPPMFAVPHTDGSLVRSWLNPDYTIPPDEPKERKVARHVAHLLSALPPGVAEIRDLEDICPREGHLQWYHGYTRVAIGLDLRHLMALAATNNLHLLPRKFQDKWPIGQVLASCYYRLYGNGEDLDITDDYCATHCGISEYNTYLQKTAEQANAFEMDLQIDLKGHALILPTAEVNLPPHMQAELNALQS